MLFHLHIRWGHTPPSCTPSFRIGEFFSHLGTIPRAYDDWDNFLASPLTMPAAHFLVHAQVHFEGGTILGLSQEAQTNNKTDVD